MVVSRKRKTQKPDGPNRTSPETQDRNLNKKDLITMNKFQMMATLIVGLAAEMDSFVPEDRKRADFNQTGETTLSFLAKTIGASVWYQLALNKAAQVAFRQQELDRFLATMEKASEECRVNEVQKTMFMEMVKFFVKNYERDGNPNAIAKQQKAV